MKKVILWTACMLFQYSIAFSCTTFLLHGNGKFVFGRNYDWITGNGLVCTNQRGVVKKSFPLRDGGQVTWTSIYGSISFNQYGKEFPTGGMNEKGLVVELMWLDGTQYPGNDDRPVIGVLQWIQYQLDNSGTIADVIHSDKTLRITSTGTPLHYLVADAGGNAATIEFLDGKMVVHQGSDLPFPVLTNNRYDESVKFVKPAVNGSDPSYRDNSLERFVKACNLVDQYTREPGTTSPVDYAFDILSEVSQGSHTKWSIAYDITSREIHFRTHGYRSRKTISLTDFDFACNVKPRAWDMNQHGVGKVSSEFTEFTLEINRKLVERSAEESKSEINFTAEAIRRNWEYAGTVNCF
jgi:penicillin V acylase-like amidase (Ntn superfamily)